MYFISSPGDGRFGLLKLLNIASNKKFSMEDVEFSPPSRNESNSDSRNTKVIAYFKGTNGFYGNKTIYYNRSHISTLPSLVVQRNGALTYGALIDVINSTYNLYLTLNDITDGALPNTVDPLVTITLPLKTTSYKFYGGTEIPTDPFQPDYIIYKSTDTLLGYLCVGYDRWAQYSDEDGSIYQMMVEQNSYECGFDDVNPRIKLTRPSNLTILEEENSGVFTLEYINPAANVTVTIASSAGLIISNPTINLSSTTLTGTFTVRSNSPGEFNIVVTNNLSIPNPSDTLFTFIDRYNTSYGVEPPSLSRVIRGIQTDDFVITGYAVDPEEDVTVTIHAQVGMVSTETSVLLTSLEPTGTFKLSAVNPGTYGLTFTNNRDLDNPTPIYVKVLFPGTIVLQTPTTQLSNGIQSDVFTLTLENGLSTITVVPEFSGTATVVPTSFLLSPSNPTGTFRVTYESTGQQTLSISNTGNAVNPSPYGFNVLARPSLSVTSPIGDLYSDVESAQFTISLVNGFTAVIVYLNTDVDHISTSSVNLTPASPTATFTVRADLGGNYFVSFSNNGSLLNPSNLALSVIQTYNTKYTVTPPSQLSLIINKESGNFAVAATKINPAEPLVVSLVKTPGLASSVEQLTLTSASPNGVFTVQSDTEGLYELDFTNNKGIADAAGYDLNIIDPGYITLTVPTTTKFINQYSDPFTVSLVNGYQSVIVSMVSPGATFSPATLTLTLAEPTKTFVVRYGSAGTKSISISNNGITINPQTAVFEINGIPSIAVTAPANPIYEGFQSDNFTVTLTNGFEDVVVSITGTVDSATATSITLSKASPVATFKITEATAGAYLLNFTNNKGYAITSQLNFTVNEFSTPVITLTAPTKTIYAGEPSSAFTVTVLNPYEEVIVTISSGANIITPTTLTLSPSASSKTFTLQYNSVGSGYVNITNNKGYVNPSDASFTVAQRPPASLTFVRETSETLYRSVATRMLVTLTNPGLGTTMISPYVLGGGTVSAPVGLTETTNTAFITFTSDPAGDYDVGIVNDKSIANPPSLQLTVLNGYVEIRPPALTLSSLIQSDWFEVEIFNYTPSVDIELQFTGTQDVSIYVDPTDVTSGTKLRLSAANKIGKFKLTKTSSEIVTMSVVNTKALAGPASVELNFFAPPQLVLTEPNVKSAFLNSTVGDYVVTLLNGTQETTVTAKYDKLYGDAYKSYVVLFMDFQGGNGTYSYPDSGPKNYSVYQEIGISGLPGMSLSNVTPINGFTSVQFTDKPHYMWMTELNNDFRFTGNFCIEVDFNTTYAGKMLLDMNSTSGAHWYLWINLLGKLEWKTSISSTPIKSTLSVNDGITKRVAVTRSGNIMRLFVDGAIVDSLIVSGTVDSTSGNLYIGAAVNVRDSAKDFIGRIGKIKITTSVDRYSTAYTPVPLGAMRSIPTSFLVSPSNTVGTFEVEASHAGPYSVYLVNDNVDIVTGTGIATFELTPYVVFTPAAGPFFRNEESASFTITLVNAGSPVVFTITRDAGLSFVETPFDLVGNNFTLNSTTPTTTFTLKANAVGSFVFFLTNDKGLDNPSAYTYVSGERTNVVLSLLAPEILVTESGFESNAFTVNLLGSEITTITVTPTGDPSLTFTPPFLVLDQSNKVRTFTVNGSTAGTYTVGISPSPVIDVLNPTTAQIEILEVSSISITNSPKVIRANQTSTNFEVTILNPPSDVLVTPIASGAVVIPSSFTLSELSPTATFTLLYDDFGFRTVEFNTDVPVTHVDSASIVVQPPDLEMSITIDPANDLFIGVESSDFVVTLHNGGWRQVTADNDGLGSDSGRLNNTFDIATVDSGYIKTDSAIKVDSAFIPKDVSVSIVSDAEVFTETEFVLNSSLDSDTFKLLSSLDGQFTITSANDSGATNSPAQILDVGSQLEIALDLQTNDIYKTKYSWPYTVTVLYLNKDVIITPVSTDPSVEFLPTSVLLTATNNSGTFRIKSSSIGSKTIGITNDSSFENPIDFNITVKERDEFYEYTEVLLLPTLPDLSVNSSYNGTLVSSSGDSISSSLAFFPNDPSRPSRRLTGGNGNAIYLQNTIGDNATNQLLNFKEEFTFEFVVKITSSANCILINFTHSTTNKLRSLVVSADMINRRIIVYDRLTPGFVKLATPANSISPTTDWGYIVLIYKNGVLKIYSDQGTGTELIGETAMTMYDTNSHGPNNGLFGGLSGSDMSSFSYSTTFYDAIRFTSKDRFNGALPSMSSFTDRFSYIGSASLRMLKPHSKFVDKNIKSQTFTVIGTKLTEPVTVTPFTSGNSKFFPESATLTIASPTANFQFLSNDAGDFVITLKDDKYLDCKDSFVLTNIAPDSLHNNVIVLIKPNGPVRTTTMKDGSNYNRTVSIVTNQATGIFALRSDLARFDKAMESYNIATSGLYVVDEASTFDLSNVDFCIEGSCYLLDGFETLAKMTLIDNVRTSSLLADQGFRIVIKGPERKMLFEAISEGNYLIPEEDTPGTIPGPHINFTYAIEYVSGVLTIYIDGSVYVSKAVVVPGRVGGTGSFRVGYPSTNTGNNCFFGGLDQVRITKGAYRYGAPYTVPMVPFSESAEQVFSAIPPSILNIFNTETSKEFTISISNLKSDCNVTLTSNNTGIVFSENTILLTKSINSKKFTVSGIPGVYQITFSNDLLISNTQVFTVTIHDSTLSPLSKTDPSRLSNFVNEQLTIGVSLTNPVTPVTLTSYADPLYGDPYRDNVVLMLDFQGNEGDKVFKDWSGYNYNFEIRGTSPSISTSNLIYGRSSLKLNAANSTDGYIKITAPADNPNVMDNFVFDGDFTIEISIRPSHDPVYDVLLSFGTLYDTVRYSLQFDGTRRPIWNDHINGTSDASVSIFGTMAELMTIYVSRVNYVLYVLVNGVIFSAKTSTGTLTAYSKTLRIGAQSYTSGNIETVYEQTQFLGSIGHLKITKGVGRYDGSKIVEGLKYPVFSENTFTLDQATPSKNISINSSVPVESKVYFLNNRKLQDLVPSEIGFFTTPSIVVTQPTTNIIVKNDISDKLTIGLTEPSKSPVEISFNLPTGIEFYSFSPNTSFVNSTTFILDIDRPTLELYFTSTATGNYSIDITNNRGLPNPAAIVFNTVIPQVTLTGPNPLNEIYFGEGSSDLTLSISAVQAPIDILVILSNGLSFVGEDAGTKEKTFTFTPATKTQLFKLISSEGGSTQQVSVTNLGEVINPNPIDIFVVNRPTIPNTLATTDYTMYLVGEDSDSRDLNLFQRFF